MLIVNTSAVYGINIAAVVNLLLVDYCSLSRHHVHVRLITLYYTTIWTRLVRYIDVMIASRLWPDTTTVTIGRKTLICVHDLSFHARNGYDSVYTNRRLTPPYLKNSVYHFYFIYLYIAFAPCKGFFSYISTR